MSREIRESIGSCNEALGGAVDPLAQTVEGYKAFVHQAGEAAKRIEEADELLDSARQTLGTIKGTSSLVVEQVDMAQGAVAGSGLEDSNNADIAQLPQALQELAGRIGPLPDYFQSHIQGVQYRFAALRAELSLLYEQIGHLAADYHELDKQPAVVQQIIENNQEYVENL